MTQFLIDFYFPKSDQVASHMVPQGYIYTILEGERRRNIGSEEIQCAIYNE